MNKAFYFCGQVIPDSLLEKHFDRLKGCFSPAGNTFYNALLDGICESKPLDAHMCYRPTRKDSKPEIEITLPQEKTISKLVLFPVEEISFYLSRKTKFNTAISGTVQVLKDGKFVDIAKFDNQNKSSEVNIKFVPQKVKTFKLIFNSNDFALSEIEAY